MKQQSKHDSNSVVDFDRIDGLPLDRIPAALAELSVAGQRLAARLLVENGGANSHAEPKNAGGRLLTVAEAAERTGMSRSFFYQRSDSLPFVRLGRSLRLPEGVVEKIRR